MAYFLGDVVDGPFVRRPAPPGHDPVLARFLARAWGRYVLEDRAARRLTWRRNVARLQVEYVRDDDDVTSLFVEVVRQHADPAFLPALDGALRATGRLRDLPFAYGTGVRALRIDRAFALPPRPPEEDDPVGDADFSPDEDGGPAARTERIRAEFVERARGPLQRLARSGRLQQGDHPLELRLERQDGVLVATRAPDDDPGEAGRVILEALAEAGLFVAVEGSRGTRIAIVVRGAS